MVITKPRIVLPHEISPEWRRSEEWVERSIGEFKHQAQLPCLHDGTEWYVEAADWDRWEVEIVEYYIRHGYSSPSVTAFIQSHVLGGPNRK